jgi:hypothetical protein
MQEGLWREDVARVRLERQHDRGDALFGGHFPRGGENLLVPAMAAIEIADGDNPAPYGGRYVGQAVEAEEGFSGGHEVFW